MVILNHPVETKGKKNREKDKKVRRRTVAVEQQAGGVFTHMSPCNIANIYSELSGSLLRK